LVGAVLAALGYHSGRLLASQVLLMLFGVLGIAAFVAFDQTCPSGKAA